MPNLSKQFTFAINANTTSTSIPPGAIPTTGTHFLSVHEKGDGYFGSGDGIHTVCYTVQAGFEGTILMQGSLATAPTADDWFDIANTTRNYTFITTPTVVTNYFNFVGNFVWVRAKVLKLGLNAGVLAIDYNR